MGTRKSVEEINYLLSQVIDKEFKHRGELAEELEISPITLNKWIEVSKYSFDDFHFYYSKSLKQQLLEKGGIDYIRECFQKGYKVHHIAEEFNANTVYVQTLIKDLLDEAELTKYDLGYNRYPYKKTDYMFQLIEEKGGLPYILSCKNQGMTIYDIVNDIGEGITRDFIVKYLNDYNLNYTSFDSYNDVYYVPHLKKWRGSIVIDEKVYDTELCDDIYSALDQVEELKKDI